MFFIKPKDTGTDDDDTDDDDTDDDDTGDTDDDILSKFPQSQNIVGLYTVDSFDTSTGVWKDMSPAGNDLSVIGGTVEGDYTRLIDKDKRIVEYSLVNHV